MSFYNDGPQHRQVLGFINGRSSEMARAVYELRLQLGRGMVQELDVYMEDGTSIHVPYLLRAKRYSDDSVIVQRVSASSFVMRAHRNAESPLAWADAEFEDREIWLGNHMRMWHESQMGAVTSRFQPTPPVAAVVTPLAAVTGYASAPSAVYAPREAWPTDAELAEFGKLFAATTAEARTRADRSDDLSAWAITDRGRDSQGHRHFVVGPQVHRLLPCIVKGLVDASNEETARRTGERMTNVVRRRIDTSLD